MEHRIPLSPVQYRELHKAIEDVETLQHDLAAAQELVRVIATLLVDKLQLPSAENVRLDRWTRELVVAGVSRSEPPTPDLFQEQPRPDGGVDVTQ